jgi:hypothetical protein
VVVIVPHRVLPQLKIMGISQRTEAELIHSGEVLATMKTRNGFGVSAFQICLTLGRDFEAREVEVRTTPNLNVSPG